MSRLHYLYLDIETVASPKAEALLPDPGDAPSNYTDPVKIAQYREKQQQALLDRAALDLDLCEVVAIGVACNEEDIGVMTRATSSESLMIGTVDVLMRDADRIIGFNVVGFDLRVLRRRALLLGLPFPSLDLGRYRYDHRIIDLQHVLSYGDGPQKGKSLDWYCQLFELQMNGQLPDLVTGADIGGLVAAGDWAAIDHHVRTDVERTRTLAQRLGLVMNRQPITVADEG